MELLVPLITLYVAALLIRPLRTRVQETQVRQRQRSTRVMRDTELGLAALNLPIRWRAASKLNDQAVLQATDPVRQRFAVVISEPREDFDTTIDLSDHAGRTLSQLADSLRVVAINGPTERTVNGCRVLQFEVEGVSPGRAARLPAQHDRGTPRVSPGARVVDALGVRSGAVRPGGGRVRGARGARPDGDGSAAARGRSTNPVPLRVSLKSARGSHAGRRGIARAVHTEPQVTQ